MARLTPRLRVATLAAAVSAGVLVGAAGLAAPASATAGDLGTPGPSFTGTGGSPTGEKPESKTWYAQGSWWASLTSAAGGYSVHRLDRTTGSWQDTGTALDNRPTTRADVLAVGGRLYVASHTFASSNTAFTTTATRLYRLTYDAGTQAYVLDGPPSTINSTSSETLTLDRDGAGRLWVSWMQAQSVKVAVSTDDGATWSAPTTLADPTGAAPTADDIGALVAFGGSVGVMWSNQATGAFVFAEHRDADAPTVWQPPVVVAQGTNLADDHLNLKADSAGRLFAVVKTSADLGGVGSAAQVLVLARGTGGSWTSTTVATVNDCHTRPVLVVDEAAQLLRVFATGATSGCPYSGYAGTVYEKTSPLSSLAFAPGRGTPVLHDAANDNVNNPTVAKTPVTAATGLVVLASNVSTGVYWLLDRAPAPQPSPTTSPTPSAEPTPTASPTPTATPTQTASPTPTATPTQTASPTPTATPAPVAAFTATPLSGRAPLRVSFRDTSTGSPTSWLWKFGNGATSTAKNPTYTYNSAGTYTVTLKVTNAGGSSTLVKSGLIRVAKKG